MIGRWDYRFFYWGRVSGAGAVWRCDEWKEDHGPAGRDQTVVSGANPRIGKGLILRVRWVGERR